MIITYIFILLQAIACLTPVIVGVMILYKLRRSEQK